MRKNQLLALGLTGTMAATGAINCTNVQKGALAGAVAGAGVGAAWGAAAGGINAWEGAAIGAVTGGLIGALGADFLTRERDDLVGERDRLLAELDSARAENDRLRAEIDRLNKRITELESLGAAMARIEVPTDLLFEPGKAVLTSSGKQQLDTIISDIRSKYPNEHINIEGHTDTQPIAYSGWKSNWELGAARALAVLHYMEDTHGIPGANLSATTYSFHRPVAGNDTSQGRYANRRAEIVIMAKRQAAVAPQ